MKTKAISGLNSFRHESGIHCHGQMRDRTAYQPFDPEAIGRRTQFTIGNQSGVSTVQAVMAENGVPVGSTDARKIMDAYHAQFQ
jgi:isopropylmalate/homocitrate/citramalate synthase